MRLGLPRDACMRAQDVKVPSLATEKQAPVGADPNLVAPLEECPICFNVLERPTRTACQHWYCRCNVSAVQTISAGA